MNNIYIGIVKKNTDGQNMGRVAVYIPELGGDPQDEAHWYIVGYASPFAGVTSPNNLVQNSTVMSGSQQSYGFWMQPPDLENQVLVCFVNGDTSKGFWFACIWQQNMNNMVPGIPTSTPTVAGSLPGTNPPTVEYNKWSDQNPQSPQRPVYTPLDQGLANQGLYTDIERGPSSSGARRESPSMVFGFLTPDGNQVYADDNPVNEFIRLRTRTGTQIMVDETTGFVYINSKEGNSWVEISDTGVDIYSLGAVSLRSEGSLNLHADGSLNIEADGNLNLRAGGNLTFQSAHNTDFAGNGHLVLQFGGVVSASSSNDLLLEASGNLRLGAGSDISQAAGGNNLRSASAIYDNSSPSAPSPNAPTATVATPEPLPDVQGSAPSYTTTPRQTITRRLPTHEPFAGHPSLGNSTPVPTTASEFSSPSVNSSTTGTFVPSSPSPTTTIPTSATDIDWLAGTMLGEANGQGNDALAAVCQTVKNRILTHYLSDGTVIGTVLRPYQYDCWTPSLRLGSSTQGKGGAVTLAGNEQYGLSTYIPMWQKHTALWANAKQIATQIMSGTYVTTNPVLLSIIGNKKAVLYLQPQTTIAARSSHTLPSWASSSKLIGAIGTQNFYYA